MGIRHASQVEARGREEASGVVATAGVVICRFDLFCCACYMSRERHATCTRTHTKCFFLTRPTFYSKQGFLATLLAVVLQVVAKQRSRTKQGDQRVLLSGYNPGLALKQIKLQSTGADLVDMTHEKHVGHLCG